MDEMNYKFEIPIPNTTLDLQLKNGSALFVLGANGVGKSTLMHKFFQQNFSHSKRITAHRQTWFHENAMSMTASQKKHREITIKNSDRVATSRWLDTHPSDRSSISIFDLINSENIRARKIASAVDVDNVIEAKSISNIQSPINAINEILAISNIPIIITLGKNDELFASKSGGELYSIAELSDGERNAFLICADVLTTDPNHLIILDEPERHLHRSIISPLLSSLFQKRADCAFVISTHDVFLPIDHPRASVLLLRSCVWQNGKVERWDADFIPESDKIPSSIKHEILGAKRKILFVEGGVESLDKQIYQLIFPSVSIIPQGNCVQVEKAVEGIKATENLHWISAFGLVDSDDRTQEQVQSLLDKGVAALECYSVESLYYHLEIVKRVAQRYAGVMGTDEDELYEKATATIIKNALPHKGRLCSRLCEKHVRSTVLKSLPKHNNILEQEEYSYHINLKTIREKEENLFDRLVAENNVNSLIARYPVRETPILSSIASGLGLTREKYESAVRKLIVDDADTKMFYRSLLASLTKLIGE